MSIGKCDSHLLKLYKKLKSRVLQSSALLELLASVYNLELLIFNPELFTITTRFYGDQIFVQIHSVGLLVFKWRKMLKLFDSVWSKEDM